MTLAVGPSAAALPRAAWCWGGCEGFRNPALVLITINVFAPYVVGAVAPGPVEGQAVRTVGTVCTVATQSRQGGLAMVLLLLGAGFLLLLTVRPPLRARGTLLPRCRWPHDRRPAMRLTCLSLALLLAAPALAQERQPRQETPFERKAEEVLRQPLKDVGIMKEEAPEILVRAQRAPYGTAGLAGCRDYARAIGELDGILGPDVDRTDGEGNPLPGRLAEAGAKTVVGMLIPFRGLVREATGAAESDRRLRQALLAGQSRRSFLKGRASARGCRL